MLRILLTISLIFSLSLSSGMSYLYAKCRPGHDDGGGGSASSSSGGGGGMSNAAGAAAAFGLLFNVLQATRAQEEDAGVDLDALAMEYATAFNVIDPTATLIVLVGGGTGVATAAALPGAAPGCSCGGDGCTCPKAFACGGATNLIYRDEKSGSILEKLVCGPSGGGTGVYIDVPPPEDTSVCYCMGYSCECPKKDTCDGAIVVKIVVKGGGTFDKLVCGRASGGGTGVAIDEPPPEDTPVCGCGGGNCKCPKEDACEVQIYRRWVKVVFNRAMDAPPGSEWARHNAEVLWNHYGKKLEEAEKRCK